MKKRNEYFASVFSRELGRWKKENHKTQEDFAEAINVEPNMISRYKKGDSRPTEDRLTAICKELCVDSSIFFPQTVADRYRYDPSFRLVVDRAQEYEETRAIAQSKIDLFFWEFLWRNVPCAEMVFPLESDNLDATDPMVRRHFDDGSLPLCSEDIDFVEELQRDVVEYISVQMLKQKLRIAFIHKSERSKSTYENLNDIITGMVIDILK